MILICAHCGAQRPRARQITGGPVLEQPAPGDAALCVRCGQWNMLGDDCQLRKPSAEEAAMLAASPAFQLARKVWGLVHGGVTEH
jgi:hypothetical protein